MRNVSDKIVEKIKMRHTIMPVLSVSKFIADVYNVRTNVYLFFA
jgi:hypothetical protein